MRTLAHLSDLHFGRHDPTIASALLESLNVSRPHLVVISGDLTQRARRSQFLAARKFLDQIQAPKLIVPGNHDIPLFNAVGRLLAPFSNFLVGAAVRTDGGKVYIGCNIESASYGLTVDLSGSRSPAAAPAVKVRSWGSCSAGVSSIAAAAAFSSR